MSVRVRVADDRHLVLESPTLVVGATWKEDRWVLGVARPTPAGRKSLIAMSYPDHPDDDGKLLRPVFQQCYCRQTSAQSGELLLVGQCGRRHFSGVVTLSPDRVGVDIADRWTVPLPLTQYGIEFQLGPDTQAEIREDSIRLTEERDGGKRWVLRPDFVQPLPGEDVVCRVDASQRLVSFVRPVWSERTPPMTISYGARLSLDEGELS